VSSLSRVINRRDTHLVFGSRNLRNCTRALSVRHKCWDAYRVPRAGIWRMVEFGRWYVSKNMRFSCPVLNIVEYTIVYTRATGTCFKQRSYLFYGPTLVSRTLSFSFRDDAIQLLTVCAPNREWKILFAPGIRCIDMEIRIAYRRRKNISKMRNVHLAARARERRFENIFDHFELVCQHFALDGPAQLDGCIDHPKCKLPTQKYNSHCCRYSCHAETWYIKIQRKNRPASPIVFASARARTQRATPARCTSRAKYKYFRRRKVITGR